ncbi:MAG: hypothetical protein JOZ45_19150 [Acidobacteriaceae bacterium]|nr:hypothetical protein [Acidobacteriaceae bacterium]
MTSGHEWLVTLPTSAYFVPYRQVGPPGTTVLSPKDQEVRTDCFRVAAQRDTLRTSTHWCGLLIAKPELVVGRYAIRVGTAVRSFDVGNANTRFPSGLRIDSPDS